jgi:hypothetical protein
MFEGFAGRVLLILLIAWIAAILAIVVRAYLGIDGESYDARRRNGRRK